MMLLTYSVVGANAMLRRVTVETGMIAKQLLRMLWRLSAECKNISKLTFIHALTHVCK